MRLFGSWTAALLAVAGCGDPPQPRVLTFGPSATLSVRGIQPDCEEITSGAEFSSSIGVSSRPTLVDEGGAPVALLQLNNQRLDEGIPVARDVEGRLSLVVGDVVCLQSEGTEEDDTFNDDRLTEARVCRTVEQDTRELLFELRMSRGACVLSIDIPAQISGDLALGDAGSI